MKNKGFTLIEFMILVAIIAIILAIAILDYQSAMGGGDGGNSAGFSELSAGDMARQTTLKKFGSMSSSIEITGSTCDGMDTDGNGRVRCTVNWITKKDKKAGNLTAIQTDVWECPSLFSMATSCVPMRAVVTPF
jgi:prepilin-type N-terminal cleavage/methylation domain-containing protein